MTLATMAVAAADIVGWGLTEVLAEGWTQLGKGVDFVEDHKIVLFMLVGMPLIGKVMRRAKGIFK